MDIKTSPRVVSFQQAIESARQPGAGNAGNVSTQNLKDALQQLQDVTADAATEQITHVVVTQPGNNRPVLLEIDASDTNKQIAETSRAFVDQLTQRK